MKSYLNIILTNEIICVSAPNIIPLQSIAGIFQLYAMLISVPIIRFALIPVGECEFTGCAQPIEIRF